MLLLTFNVALYLKHYFFTMPLFFAETQFRTAKNNLRFLSEAPVRFVAGNGVSLSLRGSGVMEGSEGRKRWSS